MKVLVNYANPAFRRSQKLNTKTAKQTGLFDKVFSYGPRDIDPLFFERNRKILSQGSGNGYWLWKPYLIEKSLRLLKEGDFLFYSDSGAYFINSIEPLVEICRQTGEEIISFEHDNLEKHWTKRDAFILMNCDTAKYTESKQRYGGFSLWRKSKFTTSFITENLGLAQDERLITDLENQMGFPNYIGFKAHRHDQSIFSLLTKSYDLDVYRDPTQWGNDSRDLYPNSKYNQLIVLTRERQQYEPISLRIERAVKGLIKRRILSR